MHIKKAVISRKVYAQIKATKVGHDGWGNACSVLYLLGMNKSGTICVAERLKNENNYHDGCSFMPKIGASTMNRAYFEIAKMGYTPGHIAHFLPKSTMKRTKPTWHWKYGSISKSWINSIYVMFNEEPTASVIRGQRDFRPIPVVIK